MDEIDVLVPVRWPAPWLAETLQSIAGQLLQPNGVIVVAHGETRELASVLRAVMPEAELVHAPSSDTFAGALNRGLLASSADLIARIDADDLWRPGHLHALSAALTGNRVLVGGGADYMDESGVALPQGVHVPRWWPDFQLLYRNPFVHSGVMYRRHVVLEVGGYQPCRAAEDLHLWLRLALAGDIALLTNTRIDYRLHTSQASGVLMTDSDVGMIWSARLQLARRIHVPKRLARMGHIRWVRHHISQNLAPHPRTTAT